MKSHQKHVETPALMWNHRGRPKRWIRLTLDVVEKIWSVFRLWLKSASRFRWGQRAGRKNPITLLHKPLIAKLAIPLEKSTYSHAPMSLISISSLQCSTMNIWTKNAYLEKIWIYCFIPFSHNTSRGNYLAVSLLPFVSSVGWDCLVQVDHNSENSGHF